LKIIPVDEDVLKPAAKPAAAKPAPPKPAPTPVEPPYVAPPRAVAPPRKPEPEPEPIVEPEPVLESAEEDDEPSVVDGSSILGLQATSLTEADVNSDLGGGIEISSMSFGDEPAEPV